MNTRREGGFTLIELMVSITIMGTIILALGSSIIIAIKATDDTNKRLSESHDAQISSAYWLTDVQSADTVFTSGTVCSGVASLVRFRWVDNVGTKDVAYYVSDIAGEHRLNRAYCLGGAPQITLTMVHFLSTTVAPTVSCTPDCGNPTSAALTITEPSGYAYTLSAARRALQ